MAEKKRDAQGNAYHREFDGHKFVLISYRPRKKKNAEKFAEKLKKDGHLVRIIKNLHGPTWLIYRTGD